MKRIAQKKRLTTGIWHKSQQHSCIYSHQHTANTHTHIYICMYAACAAHSHRSMNVSWSVRFACRCCAHFLFYKTSLVLHLHLHLNWIYFIGIYVSPNVLSLSWVSQINSAMRLSGHFVQDTFLLLFFLLADVSAIVCFLL